MAHVHRIRIGRARCAQWRWLWSSALSHHLTIGVDTGPQLDVDCSLIEQHAATIDGRRACLPRPLQKRRVRRIRDHVAHHEPGRNRVEREPAPLPILAAPSEVALTTRVADSGTERFSRHSIAEQALDVSAFTRVRNVGCLGDVAVCHPEFCRACQRELDGDRARRAAGAKNESSLTRRFRNGAQRGEKALAVGVFPDPSAVAADRAIHGSDETGRLGKLIEQFDDGHLVR